MPALIDALEARRLFAFSEYAKLIGQDVAVSEYPDLTGKGQVVAVIDTGIDYTHKSLGGGFGANFKVIAGYDFVDNDVDPRDSPLDGHGTAVAGMIAANKFTAGGVEYQGIAPDAKLVALRAGTSTGFSNENIERALRWVINNRARYGITVVNLSIGEIGRSFTADEVRINFADEYKKLRDAGVAIIAAAGNSGQTQVDSIEFPAAEPNAFAIGSIRADDKLSEFTNRGTLVDLLAPGDQVTTTKVGGGTEVIDGTSFSSPLVAGVFALLGQATDTLSANDLMSVLRSSSNTQYDDDGDPGSKTDRAYAQLDLPAAIELALKREKAGTIDYFAATKRSVFDSEYDKQGVLHLAYYDPSDQKLRYTVRLTDGRWTSPSLIDSAKGVGSALSLALDPTGKPAVAYYDAANGDLKYARFDGEGWTISLLDHKGTTGQQPSLAFTADGDAAIAYYRKTSTDLKLVTYDHHTQRWTRETVDGDGDVGTSPSIAYFRERTVDGSAFTSIQNYDTLAIAYSDESDGALKYWSRSKSLSVPDDNPLTDGVDESDFFAASDSYVTRSTVQSGQGGFDHASLSFLDVNGVGSARVAYQDVGNADVRYASRSKGAWKSFAIATDGSVGSNIDTYVDNTGSHHVVYYDYTREASYNVGITPKIGVGTFVRIGVGGSFASVASRRDGSNATLLGLNRNKNLFGLTIIG